MSEAPLGYYILYRQHFGDGSLQEVRVGPFADEQGARGAFNEFLASGDPNKSNFKLVHRNEAVLAEQA
jgi:hypothetical protein